MINPSASIATWGENRDFSRNFGSAMEGGLAEEIVYHIAAASPDYPALENVPASVIQHEKEIARSQIKGKPDNIIAKIVEGKLDAFYGEVACQSKNIFARIPLTITDLVNKKAKENGQSLVVTDFLRWSVGQ